MGGWWWGGAVSFGILCLGNALNTINTAYLYRHKDINTIYKINLNLILLEDNVPEEDTTLATTTTSQLALLLKKERKRKAALALPNTHTLPPSHVSLCVLFDYQEWWLSRMVNK